MKKHRLFASVLSVLLAASAAMTCYASTENYNDGAAHTVDSDVVNTDSSMTAVSADQSGTSVTVNGNVESAGSGVSASAGGSATVSGSAQAEMDAASASGNSSVSIGKDAVSGGITVSVTDNSTAAIGGTVNNSHSAGCAIAAENDSTVTVTGDAVSAESGGIFAINGSNVVVGGSVESSFGAVYISGNSSASIVKSVTSGGNTISVDSGSTVTVGGDVNNTLADLTYESVAVQATNDSTANVTGSVVSQEASGIRAENGSTVTVGKSVESADKTVYASGNSSASVSGDAVSNGDIVLADDHSTVNIGGDAKNSDTPTNVNCGVTSMNGSTVNIGGNVIYTGDAAVNASANSTVTVGGSVNAASMVGVDATTGSTVTVEGSVTNTQNDAVWLDSDSKVIVKGDASGGSDGINIVESQGSGGAVVVLGTVTAGDDIDSYCINVSSDALTQDEVMQALPTIIVGELSSANEQFVNYTNHSNNNALDTEAVAQAIAEQILYYIEVQDTENGSIKIDSGTTKVEGYDVAHANDTVTVTVTADQGYEIQTVNGGKATAVKNTDGSWSITVPKTGGVSISAIMAAIKQVEDETNSGGGSGDGNDAGSSVYYTPSSVYYIGDGGGTWQYVDPQENPGENSNAYYYDYNNDEYQSAADVAGIWEYIENQGYYQIDEVEGSGDYLTSIDLGNTGNSGNAGNVNKAGRTRWKWQEKNSDKNGAIEKAGWKKLRWGDYLDWYFFDNDRLMRAGFINWKGNRYFLNPISNGYRGRMLTGYQKINGLEYYFEEKDGPLQGRMYRNENVPDKRFAGPDGVIR